MRIAVGCDHAGLPLKREAIDVIRAAGHDVLDLGTNGEEPVDYPDVAEVVGQAVIAGKAERAILTCGSGVGAAIAANKLPGVRAATCHDTFSARQGVEDDDMNVLCLGARVVGAHLARELVRAFLDARFSEAERHVRRVNKIRALEERYRQPAG